MAPKGKQLAVAKAKVKATALKKSGDVEARKNFLSSLACGFRNSMKYKESERCKKACCRVHTLLQHA